MTDPMPNVRPPTGPIERMPNVRQPNKWCPELAKIHSNAVFPYQPNEIAISRTEAGHLPRDVVMIPAVGNAICQYLVIRDFGLDWRHVKSSPNHHPLFFIHPNRSQPHNSLQFPILRHMY